MIVFIQLLLAHIIGDFLLQPNSWVENKEKKKSSNSSQEESKENKEEQEKEQEEENQDNKEGNNDFKDIEDDKEEGSYYYSWQANIAMAYIDNERWYKEKTGKKTLFSSLRVLESKTPLKPKADSSAVIPGGTSNIL